MRIYLKDMSEMIAYLKRNRDILYRIILKRITEHMDSDVDEVFLFDVYLTDYQMPMEHVAKREEWYTSLTLALNYFEEVEDYETCIEVKNILDKIKN